MTVMTLSRFPRLSPRLRRLLPALAVIAVGIAGAVCASCEDHITDLKASDVVFPDSNVSYSRHVDALFQQSCASARCHAGSAPGGNLDLERPSYRALIDHVPTLVYPGDGSKSLLVLSLRGQYGKRMPLNLPALTENQIKGIQRWIDEGAVNN